MSQENVEIVRQYVDAWNRRDSDAMRGLLAADVELDRSRSIGPDPRIYRGLAEAEEFWAEWQTIWEKYRSEVDELIDADDVVAALGRFRGRGLTSGAVVEGNIAQVLTVRNGRIARICLFQSRNEAFEAAGLEGE
jgi:ketosteroid isomerase-like protein